MRRTSMLSNLSRFDTLTNLPWEKIEPPLECSETMMITF